MPKFSPNRRGTPTTWHGRSRAKVNARSVSLFPAGAARRPHGGLVLPSAPGPSFLGATAAFTSVRRFA